MFSAILSYVLALWDRSSKSFNAGHVLAQGGEVVVADIEARQRPEDGRRMDGRCTVWMALGELRMHAHGSDGGHSRAFRKSRRDLPRASCLERIPREIERRQRLVVRDAIRKRFDAI